MRGLGAITSTLILWIFPALDSEHFTKIVSHKSKGRKKLNDPLRTSYADLEILTAPLSKWNGSLGKQQRPPTVRQNVFQSWGWHNFASVWNKTVLAKRSVINCVWQKELILHAPNQCSKTTDNSDWSLWKLDGAKNEQLNWFLLLWIIYKTNII